MASICSPQMPRRAFMGVIAGGLLAAPLTAEAQQAGRVPRIGVLSSAPGATWDGFRQGLRELGYTEGLELGRVLRVLLQVVIDDPEQNEREILLARAEAELS